MLFYDVLACLMWANMCLRRRRRDVIKLSDVLVSFVRRVLFAENECPKGFMQNLTYRYLYTCMYVLLALIRSGEILSGIDI